MIECKVLIPFVSVDSNIALNVNDIIALKVERAKELEVKGLVEITANPLNLNNSSNPQAPDDGNIGKSQADNDEAPAKDDESNNIANNDEDPENDDDSNNLTNNDETPQASDDEDIGEHKLNKKSNKNKK